MTDVLERQAQTNAAVVVPHSADGPVGDDLHRTVVVGGGAAGLELVTRLGDRLGPAAERVLVEPLEPERQPSTSAFQEQHA